MKNNNGSFFKTREGILFLSGCVLFVSAVLSISVFKLIRKELLQSFLTMAVVDIIAGRGASIISGLTMGLSKIQVAIFSIIFCVIYLLITFPLFIRFYEKIIKMKLIGSVVNLTFKAADKNLTKIEQFGVLGLGIFVWVPFVMTGALIGSIIGYLMGMRTRVILIVVLISLIISAFSWTFGFEYMFELTKIAGTIYPAIIVIAGIVIILFINLRKLSKSKKTYGKSCNSKKN